METDIQLIKASLELVTKQLKDISEKVGELSSLANEVKALKLEIIEKDKRILELENKVEKMESDHGTRLDEIEQYTRMEDVIISGLNVTPRTYAKAAATSNTLPGSDDLQLPEQQNLESQVITYFQGKDIHIDPKTVAACHLLPRKDPTVKPAVIIRFANRKHKVNLMMQWKKLKDTGVYINEHLTQKNGKIAKEARQLRFDKKIISTWTRNCKVMIRVKGKNGKEEAIAVKELKDLDAYR